LRDPEGFSKAIAELFAKFYIEPATIRLEFKGVNRVLISTGKTFSEPKSIECNKDQLPKDLLEKVALLDVAGGKSEVENVGRRLWDNTYYVDMTPKAWDEFKESIGR